MVIVAFRLIYYIVLYSIIVHPDFCCDVFCCVNVRGFGGGGLAPANTFWAQSGWYRR